MARFVLVHGAFTGAWIWKALSEQLLATGHAVDVFDLPGSGQDKTPPGEVSLEGSVACLRTVLARKPEPAIIVSHSMGGIVATQGAALYPEYVSAMVYVASFLPQNGQSLLHLTKFAEAANDQVQANMEVNAESFVGTMPAMASRQVLYESCSEALAAWAISQQRPQPLALFTTPVAMPEKGLEDGIERHYVVCTRDRAIPPMMQRRMADDAGAAVHELDSDHTPHLSQVDKFAEILGQIAGA